MRSIDRGLVARIKRSYHLAAGSFEGYGESGWRGIHDLSREIHDALMSGSDDAFAGLLARPGETNLFYGFDALVRGTSSLLAADFRPWLLYTFDCFIRLAEEVQATRIWNSEGGEPWPAARPNPGPKDVESLLAAIDKRIGVKVDFPNPFPDEGGLVTDRGIATYRSPHAIYQAWRVRELESHVPGAKVLEIGAGLGRTAYYAKILGILNYTIVDLPLTNVAQALFLGQVLGPDAIWLPGDPAEEQVGRIRIVPPAWFSATDEHFDVVLNADSLPEMDRGHAAAYVEKISRKPCVFLSINHENNAFTVGDLFAAESLKYRHPYWLRKGYVEELYAFR